MINIDNIEYLDYEKLKQFGLEYIQKIGHKNWSDYNVHDPGVTFLEALCFSLVDLGYRTSFSMADLLTKSGESHPCLEHSALFPAHEIMSFNPTTMMDYRKFILENVPGIRNVKVQKGVKSVNVIGEYLGTTDKIDVKGYYETIIELEPDVSTDDVQEVIRRGVDGHYVSCDDESDYQRAFQHYVKNQLLKYRNLCEDFLDVTISQPVEVALCVEFELEDRAIRDGLSESWLCQRIYDIVSEYVSPHLKYYSIPELLQKGKTPEEIYQGALPRLGFIDKDELSQFETKTTLHVSDIIPMLLNIKGVKGIKHIHFKKHGSNGENDKYVTLEDSSKQHFVFCSNFYNENATYEKGALVNDVLLSKDWYQGYAVSGEINRSNGHRKYLKHLDVSIPQVESQYRNNKTYHSFQELLPQCYNVGRDNKGQLDDFDANINKLQLKAYLTFYDQLLSDYLAQLDSIQSFFSIEESPSIDATYFHHHLSEDEVCDIESVLKCYKSGYAETDEQALDRQDRLMDHLLARFNESFSEYAALQFVQEDKPLQNEFSLKENIEDKKRFLRKYPTLSGNRAKAIDYTESLCYSGVESRILTRLGLNNLKRCRLATNSYPVKKGAYGVKYYDNSTGPYEKTFGLHILEHVLLVPYDKNIVIDEKKRMQGGLKLTQEGSVKDLLSDPYSFHVTVVLPGWLNICRKQSFRSYAERVIREEMPAHVVAKICWIDPMMMDEFEQAYLAYLEVMRICDHPDPSPEWIEKHKKIVEKLTDIVNNIYNIYPDDYDKNRESDQLDGNIVLDFHVLNNDNTWKQLLGKKKKYNVK